MDSLSDELRMLASLLGAPESDAVAAVAGLAEQHPWLRRAADELQSLPLGEWQAEHTRLFISGYPTTPCPPFESAYLSGRLQGPQVETLGDLYRRLGLVADGASPDFLGTLLECAALVKADPRLEEAFWAELWDEHLARWLPRFCQDLQLESSLELYRALAQRLMECFPPPVAVSADDKEMSA